MSRHQNSIDSDEPTVTNLLQLWRNWLDRNVYDLARQMRLSYVPPLMVYLAAGVSGLNRYCRYFFRQGISRFIRRISGCSELLGHAALGTEDAARSSGGLTMAI